MCVPISDVIHSLQKDLTRKDEIIEEQRSRISGLMGQIRSDHSILDVLDVSVEQMDLKQCQSEQQKSATELHVNELAHRLSELNDQQILIHDEIEKSRHEAHILHDSCCALKDSVTQLSTMREHAESNIGRLNETFLTVTSEVRQLQVENEELARFRSAHSNDSLLEELAEEKRRLEELRNENTRYKSQLTWKDRELLEAQREKSGFLSDLEDIDEEIDGVRVRRAVLGEDIDEKRMLEIELDKKKGELEQKRRRIRQEKKALENEQRRIEAEQKRQLRAKQEVRRLKESIKEVDRDLINRKEKLVEAKSRMFSAQMKDKNGWAISHAKFDVDHFNREYLELKQTRREMEEQIRYLTELGHDLRDELDAAGYLAERMRRELVQAKNRPSKIQFEPIYIDANPPEPKGFRQNFDRQVDYVSHRQSECDRIRRDQEDVENRSDLFNEDIRQLRKKREAMFNISIPRRTFHLT
jgi:chromosome segregation ATPase